MKTNYLSLLSFGELERDLWTKDLSAGVRVLAFCASLLEANIFRYNL